jgi:succinate dehydrogenase/fumarate reductase flavoprotein subunit
MTTLYDVMAVLHTIVERDEDNLVAGVVVQWLRSGRLTLVRDMTVAA